MVSVAHVGVVMALLSVPKGQELWLCSQGPMLLSWNQGRVFRKVSCVVFGEAMETLSRDIGTHDQIKGKAVPLQAWTGPEGSKKLRFPDFMTTAQDGGKVLNLTHRPPLPPGNAPGTHFC